MPGASFQRVCSLHARDDYGGDSSLDNVLNADLALSDNGLSDSKPLSGGRKTTNIEYIQQKRKRTSAFRKRKLGLMKKGYELGKLTGAEVLVVVVRKDMMFSYGTPRLRDLVQTPGGKELFRQCIHMPLNNGAHSSSGEWAGQWQRHHESKATMPTISRTRYRRGSVASTSSESLYDAQSPMSSGGSQMSGELSQSLPSSYGTSRSLDERNFANLGGLSEAMQSQVFPGSAANSIDAEITSGMVVQPMLPPSETVSDTLLNSKSESKTQGFAQPGGDAMPLAMDSSALLSGVPFLPVRPNYGHADTDLSLTSSQVTGGQFHFTNPASTVSSTQQLHQLSCSAQSHMPFMHGAGSGMNILSPNCAPWGNAVPLSTSPVSPLPLDFPFM